MRLTAGVPAQAQEAVLYSFPVGPNGAYLDPLGKLTDINGVLYGTTAEGDVDTVACDTGCGTVFKVTTSGTLTVLHKFAGGSDGARPEAGLTNVNGVLYGTTAEGGPNNDGTVFKITTSGAESVLHSFDGSDGTRPTAGLTNVNGVLYGTTPEGGAHHDGGTAFKITTSGAFSDVHDFGGPGDGANPGAGLTEVNGVLYGTTYYGGAPAGCFSASCGTVFEITSSGAESVIHYFEGSDGANPDADLASLNGVLYGTTFNGGAQNIGTVFRITTSGTEKVLHSFEGGSDGKYPSFGLTNVNGVLYGITLRGGIAPPLGTVFKITTSGAESTVYRFDFGSDGCEPLAGLTNVNGVLYGTTFYGGAHNHGTIFSLSI